MSRNQYLWFPLKKLYAIANYTSRLYNPDPTAPIGLASDKTYLSEAFFLAFLLYSVVIVEIDRKDGGESGDEMRNRGAAVIKRYALVSHLSDPILFISLIITLAVGA